MEISHYGTSIIVEMYKCDLLQISIIIMAPSCVVLIRNIKGVFFIFIHCPYSFQDSLFCLCFYCLSAAHCCSFSALHWVLFLSSTWFFSCTVPHLLSYSSIRILFVLSRCLMLAVWAVYICVDKYMENVCIYLYGKNVSNVQSSSYWSASVSTGALSVIWLFCNRISPSTRSCAITCFVCAYSPIAAVSVLSLLSYGRICSFKKIPSSTR